MIISLCSLAPRGMQIKSPGGFSFNPELVAGVEAGGDAGKEYVLVHFAGGGSTRITFYRNSHDSGPPEHYHLKRNIERACNAESLVGGIIA